MIKVAVGSTLAPSVIILFPVCISGPIRQGQKLGRREYQIPLVVIISTEGIT